MRCGSEELTPGELDGLDEIVQRLIGARGVGETPLGVVLEDDVTGGVQGAPDAREEGQHLTARTPFLDHPLESPDLAFQPLQPVDHATPLLGILIEGRVVEASAAATAAAVHRAPVGRKRPPVSQGDIIPLREDVRQPP